MKRSSFLRMLLVTAVLFAAVGAGFAQMGEVADPVPYPEGVQLGDNPIVRFNLDEMLVYKRWILTASRPGLPSWSKLANCRRLRNVCRITRR